ncbi:hypothetical protein A2592_01345 [Candidatus Kaiserbacteria bacterium RIFOXYD1_FULL_42_15]|uniref:DNA methylase N-4/N-6 domain-containing protein n=1 Tax=Candidatus Kaiserbacteria bacterium RIFOXYD1_FULL_42_15 TaxID=1798532 RepID=A0A1F6FU40_9BACT|nr:MAG: hypothetical protein A2592_01345 [Candidatus Kaiserbacteria bacterium RIFOXYD1_FULL_42_15]
MATKKLQKNDIFEELTNLLKKDERLVSQDGVLLKNQTQELARKNDAALLKLLLSDKATKQHFFFEVEKTLIFDKEKFIRFVSNKQFLPDSYTAFKNKIGLTVGDEYVSESKEVVLAWPYKDCILEGGMTKEDQKRDEIFYNETLAPDDINRLLDAKVFTNLKRIDKKGEHKLSGFNRDEKGTIKDNLIIKGNNLLALASLKKEFAGKVKLIYIDPPYGKDADTFYNDSFKTSTWLTFMKNRLDLAKNFLLPEGSIFVQISDKNEGNLRLLLDAVFGPENFINKITVRTKSPSGFQTVNPGVFEVAEYILIYGKEKGSWTYNSQYIKTDYDDNYSSYIINKQDDPTKWKIIDLSEHVSNKNGFSSVKEAKIKLGKYELNAKVADFALINAESVFRLTAIGDAGKDTVGIAMESKNNKNQVYVVKRDQKIGDRYLLNGQEIAFYSKKVRNLDGELTSSIQLTNIWSDISWEGIASEGGVVLKGGKKPERLIRRIIDLGSNKNDIVLDFFAGAGTTLAVAHKIDRQYIGIEQMNYIHDLPESRLKNVIQGDQTGISKIVNWQGGGDFVYMELAKWNEEWIEKITKAKTSKELAKLWDEMKETAFLSYKVDPKTIDANVKDFVDLSIADQKKFLIECLDKNQLYVNLSEIEDKEYGVSKEDVRLNKEFYGQ